MFPQPAPPTRTPSDPQVQPLPCVEGTSLDELEKWTFTVCDRPPEEREVTQLTLSSERMNDEEWIAAYCAAHDIRLVPSPPPPGYVPPQRRHRDEQS